MFSCTPLQVHCALTKLIFQLMSIFIRRQHLLNWVEGAHLKLWIEGEEERLSCAIKAIADFKGLRC